MASLVLFLAVVVAALVLIVIWTYYYKKTSRELSGLSQKLDDANQQLRIAEEGFYSRKMSQQVFEKILHDYKAQTIELQLQMNKLKGKRKIDVSKKKEALEEGIKNPTRAQSHRLEKLLIEAETLHQDLGFLQNKLLKREIDEALFTQLSEEKQKQLIKIQAKVKKLTTEAKQQAETQGAKAESKPQ